MFEGKAMSLPLHYGARISYCLTYKYETRRGKRSSLFALAFSDGQKKFHDIDTRIKEQTV
jgi:hypothetical protein